MSRTKNFPTYRTSPSGGERNSKHYRHYGGEDKSVPLSHHLVVVIQRRGPFSFYHQCYLALPGYTECQLQDIASDRRSIHTICHRVERSDKFDDLNFEKGRERRGLYSKEMPSSFFPLSSLEWGLRVSNFFFHFWGSRKVFFSYPAESAAPLSGRTT